MAGTLDGLWVLKVAGETQPRLCVELQNVDFRLEPPTDVLFGHVWRNTGTGCQHSKFRSWISSLLRKNRQLWPCWSQDPHLQNAGVSYSAPSVPLSPRAALACPLTPAYVGTMSAVFNLGE